MRRILRLAAIAMLTAGALNACVDPQWLSFAADEWLETPRLMEAGDFNGDGILEVAGISAYHAFVLTVPKDGAITSATYAYQDGRYLNGLAVGDFTSDGRLDLLVIDRDAKQLVVLPGKGDGSFESTPVFTALPDFPYALASADVNGDGIRDALVAFNDLHVVIAYAGDGHGGFTEVGRSAVDPASTHMAAGDLDGDGFTDVVVTHEASAVIDVLFGAGDGTFASAVKLTGRKNPVGIRLVDIDGDGDLDLLFADWTDEGVSVHVNYGGRTFGPPAVYGASPSGTQWGGSADIIAADFNGDGNPDVVLLTGGATLITIPGRGDGTFGTAVRGTTIPYSGASAGVVVDFDADGRPDVVLSTILAARNRCGLSQITLSGPTPYGIPPVVSVGQSFRVTVSVSSLLSGGRKGTGNVEMKIGTQTVASGTLANGSAAVDVIAPAAGDQPLIAWYLGDEEFDPANSAPVALHVTTDTTRTTVTTSRSRTEYGEPLDVVASVESSTGDRPGGHIYILIDGAARGSYADGDAPRTTIQVTPAAGAHDFSARYVGDSTHPPSFSPLVGHTVTRSVPEVSRTLLLSSSVSGSGTVSFLLSNRWGYGVPPSGTVTLVEGQSAVATISLPAVTYTGNATATFSAASLAPGTHYLHVEYAGDSNYEPVSGPAGIHIVYPDSNMHLDARGDAANVVVTWVPASAEVEMRTLPSQTWSNSSVHDPGRTYPWPVRGTVYLFRPKTTVNGITAIGPADLGQLVSFTDDPLTPGTVIKAQHLSEIIIALNRIRAGISLAPVSLSVGAGSVMRAADIASLRSWITETRSAAGVYPVTFTNPVRPGDPIRAADIQELREAVR